MKRTSLLIVLCLNISLFTFCQANKDSVAKKPMPPPDRNMFGLYSPRGLKINSDGLEPGYVLFAVPNSSLFYLINRKGEVVHQWKGNYGVLGGYLQADGSIIQTAVDPDFPVFGG